MQQDLDSLLSDKQLLIFDCDGVLFDSHDANVAYFNECLAAGGYPPVREEEHGPVNYMSVRQLIDALITDREEAERVHRLAMTLPYEPYLPKLKPLFDFQAVLGELRKSHYLAVASNRGKSLSMVFRYFNLYDYFHFKVSVLHARPKPDPDMLLHCLAYFDLAPDRAVFLGDAVTDLRAARAACIPYIAVGEGEGDARIKSAVELLKSIDGATPSVL